MSRKRKVESKARHFTFLIYPDSAPTGWLEVLRDIGLPMAISPIHDKDEADQKRVEATISDSRNIWSEEQQEEYRRSHKYKKEHYHVVYVSKTPITPSAVRNRLQRALGNLAVNMVQVVDNIENMYLYLSHDSASAIEEGKYKYAKDDIVHLNNFDIDRYITLDKEEKNELLNIITDMIIDENILNIVNLDIFVKEHGEKYGINNFYVFKSVLRENTYYIKQYLDGVYQNKHRDNE